MAQHGLIYEEYRRSHPEMILAGSAQDYDCITGCGMLKALHHCYETDDYNASEFAYEGILEDAIAIAIEQGLMEAPASALEEEEAGDSEAEHILSLVPKGTGVLFKADGTREEVQGPFGENVTTLLNCAYMQAVPAMIGALKGKALLLMDEDGQMNHPQVNAQASQAVGDQVIGGRLYGSVLVVHEGDFD